MKIEIDLDDVFRDNEGGPSESVQESVRLRAENEALRKALASDARIEAIFEAILTPRGNPEDGTRDHLPRQLRDYLSEAGAASFKTGWDDGYAEGLGKAAARAESSETLVAELREKVVDLTHREKVRSEAINRSLTDANERADAAQARADLAIKLFDQREEYLSGLIARNAELRENNARLREALEPFAKRAERYDPDEADDGEPDWSTASPSIRIGDLRRARSELEGR